MQTIRALLCDLDGTLIESESLHYEAWRLLMLEYGHTVDTRWNDAYIGLPDTFAATGLYETYPGLPDADHILEEKQEIYRRLVRERGAGLVFPGVPERLKTLRQAGVRLAVGTNSIRKNTLFCLESVGIADMFEAVITLESVKNGKPLPDIYLAAADALGVGPGQAAVAEDSAAGVAAGKAAGCLVLGVLTTWPAETIAQADHMFPDTPAALDWVLANSRPV